MNIENDTIENTEPVTPVGNAWVICRSKSYPGRVYYFNTLTGESAWNLSETEVQKAKKKPPNEENFTSNQEEFPEPVDPPSDKIPAESVFINKEQTCQTPWPQRVYNKQVINNRFQKSCMISPIVRPQFHPFSSPINSIGFPLPTIPNYNPNVWAVHPHQYFIPSNDSSFANHIPNNFNNNSQAFMLQNPSIPQSNRFTSRFKMYQKKFSSYNDNYRHNINKRQKIFKKDDHNDLRQVLHTKRKSGTYKYQDFSEDINSEEMSNNKRDLSKGDKNINNIDKDNYYEMTELQEEDNDEYLNLDTLSLRNLASSTVNPDYWYIVADVDVYLNNLNFVKGLLLSDHSCHIMVPTHVMSALRALTRIVSSSEVMTRARRVVNFLSYQMDAGHAILDSNLPCGTVAEPKILDVCLKLSRQNNFVVLISNDQSLKKKKSINLRVFCVKELKDFLNKHCLDSASEPPIEITFRNDNSLKDCAINTVTATNMPENTEDTFAKQKVSLQTKEINIQTETNLVVTKKIMADAEVQTDTEYFADHKNDLSSDNTSHIDTMVQCNMKEDSHDNLDHDNSVKTVQKRKDIKLNRNISLASKQSNHSFNNEKRCFRWRKSRTHNMNSNNGSVIAVNNAPVQDSNPRSVSSVTEQKTKNLILRQNSSTCNVDDEQHDSNQIIETDALEKLNIEETASSSHKSNQVDSSTIVPSKNFKITGKVMEEYLSMGCEEWVPRFVQIMEEVLSEVLNLEPSFNDPKMPPPWTIHEATECIRRKFSNNINVCSIAEQLSITLFQLSDVYGKINTKLTPSDFMNMYSLGVYLVEALQKILPDSEDILTALESLEKLLKDIQEPNLEAGSMNMFTDVQSEDLTKISVINYGRSVEEYETENVNNLEKCSPPSKNQKEDQGEERHNMKVRKITTDNGGNDNQTIKFIRNFDVASTFSQCLNNQTKKSENTQTINNTEASKNKGDLTNTTPPNVTHPIITCTPTHILQINEQNDQQMEEPRIIRKFNKCMEFEERLRNYHSEPSDLDALDYGEDLNDYEEYSKDDEYYNEDEYDEDNLDDSESLQTQSPKAVDGNKNFRNLIEMILSEVKEAFSKISTFCATARQELLQENQNIDCTDLKEKCEIVHSYIANLVETFKSILERDNSDTEKNISKLLADAGFDNMIIDIQNIDAYRQHIRKCSSQAEILMKAVETLLDVLN